MRSEEEKVALRKKKTDASPTNWPRVLWTSLALLGILLLLALCLPWLAYRWLRLKAANAKDARRYYWQYHAMMFYLHQMGIERQQQSPLQFARQQVDARFGTRLAEYVNVYLKLKYARQPLTDREAVLANTVYAEVLQQVSTKLKPGYRFSHFINLRRSLQYVAKPSMYA
jgi:4-amino-4-deoxy-L-arabinose transferase-like glycosyltransferase